MNIYEKLSELQSKISVGKNNKNDFGKYKYRSVDDIYAEIKPYIDNLKVVILITNNFIVIGEDNICKQSKDTKNEYHGTGIMVQSIVKMVNSEKPDEVIETQAFAKLDLMRAGMSYEQMTGAAISYANKYALTSLLLLSANEKDIDEEDNTKLHEKTNPKVAQKQYTANKTPQKIIESQTLQKLQELVKKSNANTEKILQFYKKQSLSELTELEAISVINSITKDIVKKEKANAQ